MNTIRNKEEQAAIKGLLLIEKMNQIILIKSKTWPVTQFIQDDLLFLHNAYPSEV